MRRLRAMLLPSLLVLLAGGTMAKEAPPLADDPKVDARLMQISKELRCLVCQNETLADSQADLAKDLRDEVRGLIARGETDAQIKAYLTQRYGDFVLYRPRFSLTNALLWLGPFFVLIGTGIAVFLFIKQRRETLDDTPLSAEEAARVQALLPGDNGKPGA